MHSSARAPSLLGLRLLLLAGLAAAVWLAANLGALWTAVHSAPGPAAAPARPLPFDPAAARRKTRFLEEKVRRDPDDADALDRLAASYLQTLRETGSLQYLELAQRAARASLASVPAVRNGNGLTALALAELASHDFGAARDRARQLARIDPAKAYPYAILGDALLELGDYDRAAAAYASMERRSGGITVETATRAARLAQLRGDNDGAARHFSTALVLALNLPVPPRETVAWCHWQLGETAFAQGDYAAAEAHDRDALVVFPGYYRAVASLARARAARGDLPDAIDGYAQAIRLLPDPAYVAALGDLYRLTGRPADAQAQYDLVEQIGRLSAVNGVLYNRQLALFYADHDVRTEAGYAQAKREYAARRDVYGADALAWTALKTHRIAQAQTAMKAALRLGTRDAKLWYHAGMIARAAGDAPAARAYLRRALELSPQFDPLGAGIARQAE